MAATTLHMMVVMAMCVLASHAQNNPWRRVPANRRQGIRCTTAAKPCRMRAEVISADGSDVIESPSCVCNDGSDCSSDWENDRNRTLVKELRTNGNINMTVGLMFCGELPRLPRCRSDQVALVLKGWVIMPTEIHTLNCSCGSTRHLVQHSQWWDDNAQQFNAYVCSNHKRPCKRNRTNPDICQITDNSTGHVLFPCRCTSGSSCHTNRQGNNFCKRPRRQ